ncbi:MAG: hypothetical protein ACOC1F_10555 [Myxococcota bacterium]
MSPEAGTKDGGAEADVEAGDAGDAEPDGGATCQGLDTSSAKPLTGCGWSGYRGSPTYVNGTSDTDIWVTSGAGPVMHFDGQAWKTFELNRRGYRDTVVFGTDFVLLGLGSDALGYFDGTTWNTLDLGVEGSASRLWATSQCNIWATGMKDYWLHNDGSGWRKVDDPFDWGRAMWGTAADDMFLIGSEMVGHLDVLVPAGRIAHWDGAEWTEVWREEYRDIRGIWGTASDDVFAVGGLDPMESLVLHFDGQTWTEMPMPAHQAKLDTVFGFAPDDVYAAGLAGIIMHYDGASWKVLFEAPSEWGCVSDIWGPSPDSVYFAAIEGLWRWDGTSMMRLFHWGPQSIDHNAMAASGADNIFTVGYRGSITHWDGTDWTVMESGTAGALYGIWTTGPDNAYAAGMDETVLHYDGQSWTPVDVQGIEGFKGVWGTAEDDVYIAGKNGLLAHYDGSVWTAVDTGTERWLKWITGTGPNDIWVSDNDDGLLHFDGSAWQPIDPPGPVRGIASVVPNELWLATHQSAYHFDGTNWVNQYLPIHQGYEYTTIFGKSPQDIYVGGGYMMYFDGAEWTQLGDGMGLRSKGMWAADPQDVWATNVGGVIVHYGCR